MNIMAENEKVNAAPEAAAPAPAAKPPKKPTLPGVLALRKVVNDVYQAAWDAKKAGKPVGWSSSKFPCEICEALDLAVVYPENQAAGIGARHDGQRMCEFPWPIPQVLRQPTRPAVFPCRISFSAATTSATI